MLHIGYTVSEVKKRHRLRETTATNGPEGTVFNKTQVSLKLLEEGMYRLHNSMAQLTMIILKMYCAHYSQQL